MAIIALFYHKIDLSNKLFAIEFFIYGQCKMQTIYWNQTKMTKNVVHVGPVIQVRYKIGIITNAVYMQLEKKKLSIYD